MTKLELVKIALKFIYFLYLYFTSLPNRTQSGLNHFLPFCPHNNPVAEVPKIWKPLDITENAYRNIGTS